MKRIIVVFVIAAFFTACNENGVTVEGQVDSLGTKLDTLGDKIEQKAEQVWDSTIEKAADLKDKAKQEWDSAKAKNRDNDTVNKK